MIQWSREEPKGSIIIAKLKNDFVGTSDYYEVLHSINVCGNTNNYFDSIGEEVPLSAIEKWALIK